MAADRQSVNLSVEDAREYFPRGLSQPEGGFRFSADALLLACFAGPGAARSIADLGTGCGVVALSLLLRDEAGCASALGFDVNPQMLAAARENADRLGFASRFSACEGNVSNIRRLGLTAESFDLVVCNPPYRETGTGRRPVDAGRDAARFEACAPIGDFASAAAYLVRNRGRVCFIGLPERLPQLLTDLAACRLEAKRLRLVHSRMDAPAKLALVEAVKNARPCLSVEPPLVMYTGEGSETKLSDATLAFCPFLSCNAGARAK